MSLISIGSRVNLDFEYAKSGYALDCRLLFKGDHVRQLVRTYQEIVYRFSYISAVNRLYESLESSPEIQQFYEVALKNGKVSVTMRDEIFREQGPLQDMNLSIKVCDGRKTLFQPFPVNRLRALGQLLPLLTGDHQEAEIAPRMHGRLPEEEASWALTFFESLDDHGFLECDRQIPNHFPGGSSRPRVTFLGHSSLLFQSPQTNILIDPILRFSFGLKRAAFDVARLKLGAICCSHSHWDHCDLQTLLWFEKNTPILVPRVERPTIFNPPIVPALELLGFTNIREVELWKPIQIMDIELIPVPFYGEQDEPGADIDHYTYVLRANGFTLYGGVDCFRDTYGQMEPALEKVKKLYRPDVAFLPISKMTYTYRHGGVNGFCRYFDADLMNQSFQYTGSGQDAAAWTLALRPKYVAPYATFTFPRWSVPPEIQGFAQALKRVGLAKSLYPFLPLASLDSSQLRDNRLSALRRFLLVHWLTLGSRLKDFDRRLSRYRPYAFLWKVTKYLLARPAKS